MTDQPYQLLPALSDEEYAALRDDIAANGIRVPVDVDEHGQTLDGHHRQAIAAELGIDCPTRVVAGLTEDDKRAHALAVNLQRRTLTREQRRALIVAELEHDPSRSDRAIGRLLGVDHKTVGSVRRDVGGEFPHPAGPMDHVVSEYQSGQALAKTLESDEASKKRVAASPIEIAAELGLPVGEDFMITFRETTALRNAARRLLRDGHVEAPPSWWRPVAKPISPTVRMLNARYGLHAEMRRLHEWENRVSAETGRFLTWCDDAGIGIDKTPITFADRLRYPLEDGVQLPDGFSADDEHNAALGHFYCWFFTLDEMVRMAPGGAS